MADIKIAAGVLPIRLRAVGRQPRSSTEIPVRSNLVQCVGVGVASYHRQAMEVSRRESGLQCVVIGAVGVAHLENLREERKLAVEGARVLFSPGIRAPRASAERRYAVYRIAVHASGD